VRGVSGADAATALLRLAVVVRGEDAEPALAALLELAPEGVEERAVQDGVEYSLYGSPDELPAAAELEARLGRALVAVRAEPVANGWERRWHEYLRAVTVEEAGRAITIRPPWLAGEPGDLVIHPDVLFGAGTHPTTRLVLRLLLAEPRAEGSLCDWGAGTGVLAVAAARLGWAPVGAIELDAAATGIIARNAAANGVEVSARAGDLTAEDPPWAATVCANLFAPLLVRLAGSVARPPERLLLSGVLVGEADDVAAAWAERGMREARRLEEEGWAGVLLDWR
jgi:ribosomal protein L11 methyltransferase